MSIIKISTFLMALVLIGSLITINLWGEPVEAQIIPSAVGAVSSITKVTVTATMDLFIPIIFEIVNIVRKITAVTFSLFGFTEPFLKYAQSIIGITIFEYFGEFGYLIYYGFIRPVILDVVLVGFFVVSTLINMIGIIPIISIPCALIVVFIDLFVIIPLAISIVSYFPEGNLNPLTQGMNRMKTGLTGSVAGLIWVVVAILLIIYSIGMVIPVINVLAVFIYNIIIWIIIVIVCILLPILAFTFNIGYIFPTLTNYTPIVNLIKRIPSGTINLITDVIYKTIDLISVFNI